MKYLIADFAGFCHGVRHTITTIEDTLKTSRENVYSIGLPIHNPQLTQRLISKGLKVVDCADDVNEGVLIVRAHGLPPQEIYDVQKRGVQIIDATCGFVLRAQHIVRQLFEEKYRIIIAGEREHPEVKSLLGVADRAAVVCDSVAEVEAISSDGQYGIVSQTTFSDKLYKEMLGVLIKKQFREIRIFNTVCASIEKRALAAQDIARRVDLMLIIGGNMSANTRRLFEACKTVNINSYHIETKEDMKNEWFLKVSLVGITAGASTPDWVVDEIKEELDGRK
jgi:(E)-4-hydroxy-3-methyl-but-2-enyl pyrophosphate reductase